MEVIDIETDELIPEEDLVELGVIEYSVHANLKGKTYKKYLYSLLGENIKMFAVLEKLKGTDTMFEESVAGSLEEVQDDRMDDIRKMAGMIPTELSDNDKIRVKSAVAQRITSDPILAVRKLKIGN